MNKDIISLATEIITAARAKGLTIATVESCTGGLVSAALTEISGSSEVFMQGFVTYSNDAKAQAVGVQQNTLNTHGAVSKECAMEMAQGGQKTAAVDISVSITGIAGPGGGSEAKPVGTVHFGLAHPNGVDHSHQVFKGSRHEVREQSVVHALNLIKNVIG